MHLGSPELYSTHTEPKTPKEPGLFRIADAELDNCGENGPSPIAVCPDSIHSNSQPTNDNKSFNAYGILIGFVSGGLIWAGVGMLLGVRAMVAIMGCLCLLLVLAIGTAMWLREIHQKALMRLRLPETQAW
jgi:hypothetical protein